MARALGGSQRPYVLYAATLHPRKNLAALREAMAGLVAQGRPHALAVAGGPAPDRADSSELERAASADLPGVEGRVARLPALTDQELAGLMAGAAAFALPSLYEGFGLVVLEAMVRGTPVLAARATALPETGGEAAAYFDPADPGDLGRALEALLGGEADRAELSRRGLEHMRRFSWERAARQTAAVYQELLAR